MSPDVLVTSPGAGADGLTWDGGSLLRLQLPGEDLFLHNPHTPVKNRNSNGLEKLSQSFLLWSTSFKFAVYILILTQMGPFYTSYILTLILILNILHLTDTDCWTNSPGSNISLMFILLKPQA